MEELGSARSFLKRVRGAFNYRLSIFNASLCAAAGRRLTGAVPVTSRIPQISAIPSCEASRSFVYANIPRACDCYVRSGSLKGSMQIAARADIRNVRKRSSDPSDRRSDRRADCALPRSYRSSDHERSWNRVPRRRTCRKIERHEVKRSRPRLPRAISASFWLTKIALRKMASLVEKNHAVISVSGSLAKRRAIYGEESRLRLRRVSSGPKHLFASSLLDPWESSPRCNATTRRWMRWSMHDVISCAKLVPRAQPMRIALLLNREKRSPHPARWIEFLLASSRAKIAPCLSVSI